VSGQYAASSGGEGGKLLGAKALKPQYRLMITPTNPRTMKYDTKKRTLKVQYQNNEAQDTNITEAYKKKILLYHGDFFP
jgi:hypothetical protein